MARELIAVPSGVRFQAARRGPLRSPLSGWPFAIAAAQAVILLATSTRYGYHRDELYFIVAGGHAAFGYPDQPPIVPIVAWAMHAIAPGSLTVLRTPSALVSAATTILAAVIAREVGGERRAQVIAAACTAVSAFALAVGHIVSTTTPDMLSTTALGWLMIRAVVTERPGNLLAAGIVVGIGFEAKPQVGLVAAVMVLSLAAIGPRWPLRSSWGIAGALTAVLLAAPYLVWQQAHGWPQLTVAHNIAGNAEGGRVGFIPFQLVMVSPLLVPVWIAGVVAPFRRASWRALRFVPITYLAAAVLYILGNGKAYYLASLYPILLGLGSLPTADWTLRSRGRSRALVLAIALSGLISAYVALPLLPVRQLQGSAPFKLNPDLGEQVGWPRFIATVADAWQAIPPTQRRHAVIFTYNYGEAGAIDVLGAERGLPRAYSGHNGFSEWGEPPASDLNVLLIGYNDAAAAAPDFAGCRTLATINDGVGLNNDEQGLPVLLCRVTRPWRTLWSGLTHYN
jgi:4-amino-4-deoxy-L-arabinose transferase-like glycosyltransferase